MSTTVNQYRFLCVTEGLNVSSWGTSAPTLCPNNSAHTVDLTTMAINNTVKNSNVVITQETIPTGGHWCHKSIDFSATGGTGTTFSFSHPIPVTLLSGSIKTVDSQSGDSFSIDVVIPSAVGAITANVSIGDTVVTVNSTAYNNVSVGYYIKLTDGTNTSILSRVVSKGGSLQLTLQTAMDIAFSASTPTFVHMLIRAVDNVLFGPTANNRIGAFKIGGTTIPANVPLVMTYVNNSGTAQHPVVHYDYLY